MACLVQVTDQLSLIIPVTVNHRHLEEINEGNLYLPPVGILSVDNLKDVAFFEGHARLATGDQVIIGRIVVKVWPHIHL